MSELGRAGAYRLGRLIRRGGQAEVYEAFIESPGGFSRRVAMKRLLASAEPDLVRRFTDEARIAAELHHAGIVAVLDAGVDGDTPYQILELIDGPDLRSAAALVRPSAAVALHVVAELGHALDYAHNAKDGHGRNLGIIHRDVAPDNVLLSWAGDVKLGDFGIARALIGVERTRVGLVHGKRSYMAPEQAKGEGVDFRADLFSLGCLLHFLLSGRNPLDDEKLQAEVISGLSFPVAKDLEPDLAAIVARATRYTSADRPASAMAMASDCRRALLQRGVEDGRAAIRSWLAEIETRMKSAGELRTPSPAERRPMSQMLNLDLVLGTAPQANLQADVPATVAEVRAADPADPAERSTAPGPDLADEPTPVENLVGRVIDGLRVDRILGEGSHGQVYAVTRVEDGQPFAIKVLAAVDDPRLAVRLRREASLLIDLRHPNLVRVHRYGQTPEGVLYLVMDRIDGGSLLDMLERGPLPLEHALRIARQIALGLIEIHKRLIVHRDLKPSNVMLSGSAPFEQVRLVDFGVARLVDGDQTRLTRQGLLGTAAYTAPEQFTDAHQVGPAADLYALGAVLYFMLVGTRPFTGPPAAILIAHDEGRLPRVEQAGVAAPLLRTLLAKDPGARPSSAEAVVAAIDQLGSTVINQTLLAPIEKPPAPKRYRVGAPSVAAAAIILLLGLGVAVGSFFGGRREEEHPAREPARPVVAKGSRTATISTAPEATAPPLKLEPLPSVEPKKPSPRPKKAEPVSPSEGRKEIASGPAPGAVDRPPTEPQLRAELEQLFKLLGESKAKLSTEQLRRFDNNYLDIEAALSRGALTPERARALLERIRAFRLELAAAL